MSIIIEVTIYDEDTGVVEQRIIETHSGYRGYEVAEDFEKLGRRVAEIIHPGWDG